MNDKAIRIPKSDDGRKCDMVQEGVFCDECGSLALLMLTDWAPITQTDDRLRLVYICQCGKHHIYKLGFPRKLGSELFKILRPLEATDEQVRRARCAEGVIDTPSDIYSLDDLRDAEFERDLAEEKEENEKKENLG